jgi:hypothetical protein
MSATYPLDAISEARLVRALVKRWLPIWALSLVTGLSHDQIDSELAALARRHNYQLVRSRYFGWARSYRLVP